MPRHDKVTRFPLLSPELRLYFTDMIEIDSSVKCGWNLDTVVIVCVSLSCPRTCSMLLQILSAAHLAIITEDTYRPIANLEKKKRCGYLSEM